MSSFIGGVPNPTTTTTSTPLGRRWIENRERMRREGKVRGVDYDIPKGAMKLPKLGAPMKLPTRGWQGRWGGIEERPMKHYATDEEFEADTGRKVHPSMKGELAKAAARRKEEMERRASARPYEPAMRGIAPRPRTYPKGMITKDLVGVDIRRDIPVST